MKHFPAKFKACIAYFVQCRIHIVMRRHAQEMPPNMLDIKLMVGSWASPSPKIIAKFVRWSHSQTVREWMDLRRLKTHPVWFQASEPKSQNTHSGKSRLVLPTWSNATTTWSRSFPLVSPCFSNASWTLITEKSTIVSNRPCTRLSPDARDVG